MEYSDTGLYWTVSSRLTVFILAISAVSVAAMIDMVFSIPRSYCHRSRSVDSSILAPPPLTSLYHITPTAVQRPSYYGISVHDCCDEHGRIGVACWSEGCLAENQSFRISIRPSPYFMSEKCIQIYNQLDETKLWNFSVPSAYWCFARCPAIRPSWWMILGRSQYFRRQLFAMRRIIFREKIIFRDACDNVVVALQSRLHVCRNSGQWIEGRQVLI